MDESTPLYNFGNSVEKDERSEDDDIVIQFVQLISCLLLSCFTLFDLVLGIWGSVIFGIYSKGSNLIDPEPCNMTTATALIMTCSVCYFSFFIFKISLVCCHCFGCRKKRIYLVPSICFFYIPCLIINGISCTILAFIGGNRKCQEIHVQEFAFSITSVILMSLIICIWTCQNCLLGGCKLVAANED
ncbi:predicted protein [Naegleria gruberi]|uniref:Predicted protein n=1 Tax=Naegleria gruberi TaxID=5762 RepID=D2VPV7_NAEGR|nr:uncharacterized protein NAEGRDRAFT_71002 [Naegleria gruberi]EFC41193.1 predicted protein [Naegleria gruberi]|eukprot:XP_002673937.1 predicted protein [Naegleria gruberi strain NEG-M]